ncbi:hypothetical protein PYW08_011300 [Mythimna loreyi]|uniref:Uncharacterized protein n=1 Tax=Mythimna loreyi TaxID=667449 RepID=A0ACC2Q361_9NEOP|nr:hypothetical protein PYW08_011300 [Mythimna loreyi]
MYSKGIVAVCLLVVILQNASTLPIGFQGSLNAPGCNQQLIPEAMPGSPVITEIVPSLQFGDISVTGDLPVGGSIKVKGMFPVYGTVALDGGLPSCGTAVVNTGSAVVTQFGDISVTGDLPVGGSIKVKGMFPVYGTVALDGGLPSCGTAVVNTGSAVVTQVV